MSLKLLPAAHRIAKPWKNGGGTTRDVMVMPEGAGMEDFDWRVSIADVASDGPFSAFPGVDRIIAILSGEGIRLDVEGRLAATLTPLSMPYAFPGDAPTTGTLLGGPITDLNLMFRRGMVCARMRRVHLTHETEFPLGPALVLWLEGNADIIDGGTVISPERLDAVFAGAFTPLMITPHSSCSFYLIDLESA